MALLIKRDPDIEPFDPLAGISDARTIRARMASGGTENGAAD
jgi:hypothetical protein